MRRGREKGIRLDTRRAMAVTSTHRVICLYALRDLKTPLKSGKMMMDKMHKQVGNVLVCMCVGGYVFVLLSVWTSKTAGWMYFGSCYESRTEQTCALSVCSVCIRACVRVCVTVPVTQASSAGELG